MSLFHIGILCHYSIPIFLINIYVLCNIYINNKLSRNCLVEVVYYLNRYFICYYCYCYTSGGITLPFLIIILYIIYYYIYFISSISKQHSNIIFTSNISTTSVNFLDVTIDLHGGHISTKTYTKSTDTHAFLSYNSFHPRHIK